MNEKTAIARNGQTFDSLAFENYGDGYELYFPVIMEANRQYSRVLAFEGGEKVIIPLDGDAPVITATGDPSSQTTIQIISTPW